MKGLRFQKRFKLAPGITLNVSKSGIGISAGVPGAHIGISGDGKKYESLGLPGTGLSYRHYERGPRKTVAARVWDWLTRP